MARRRLLKIGARLRAARKKAGMTLEMLSQASGVSKAMLSQIEQDKANPTVAVLFNVAAALNLDVAELLGRIGMRTKFIVIHGDDDRHVFVSNESVSIRTLSPLEMEKDIEFYEVTLHPGAALESDAHFHGTEEIAAVARGRVRVVVEERESILRKGDSACYSADVKHALINLSRGDSILYLVVRYREGS